VVASKLASEPFRSSIFIEAAPEEVFPYFTEAEAIVAWMGDRAIVEPSPGGRFVLHFDDRVVEGRYLAVEFPRRIVITWGRHGSVRLPPGGSTLEVSLEPEGTGTRVSIVHDGLPGPEQELHAQGWAHYLPRLAAVASGKPVAAHHVPRHLVEGAD
jgi:uncharacterized protein YndB with AHSA1/START domain